MASAASKSSAPGRLRTVFFGTSTFAVPSLGALADSHHVVAVVTQPDRPAGRGQKMRQTPVMQSSRALGLTAFDPQRLDAGFVDSISALSPQLLVCASYGKILPASLLGLAGLTPLNIHPSLLPEYRGATPIQTALRDGRDRTGLTIFWMTDVMDAGDVVMRREVAIGADENCGGLHDRLAALAAEMIVEAAALASDGALSRTAQDHARATFTKPIRKGDLRIPEGEPARSIVNFIRSASPNPAAWTIVDGKRVKVLEARAEPADAASSLSEGPLIGAADGFVRMLRVIPEGKPEMTGAQFANLVSRAR